MNAKTKGVRNRGSRYPWAEWFAKGKFTLRRGRDYTIPSYTMAQQVRNWASPHRFDVGKLSIDIFADGIVVEIVGKSKKNGKKVAK